MRCSWKSGSRTRKHAQDVARLLQGRQIGSLLAGVFDHEEDVHYGLGGESWYGGGSDMLDRERRLPQSRPNLHLLPVEAPGPGGIVVRDDDGLRFDLPDNDLS